LRILEGARAAIDLDPDAVLLCLTPTDVDEALASDRIGLIIALEGCVPIGADVELLRVFHRLGLRMASLTHLGRTPLADGSAEEGAGGRLTAAGIRAVELMESLGILVDISHLSLHGLRHVLEIATRPLVASHSGARALCGYHRNIPDAELRAIAAGGGVIGVPAVGPMLVEQGAATLEHVLDQVEHIASVAGVGHVGLGPDFFEEVGRVLYPGPPMPWSGVVDGLATPMDLPGVWDALLGRGFSEPDAAGVMGGNFIRVFRQALGVPRATTPTLATS
jgi:membrane dipeptidase